MTARLVHRNARSVPWAGEEALALMGEQDSNSRDIGPRTSKSSSPPEEPDNRILRGYCGAKEFGNPAYFISSPRPMPRRKKCPRMNKEGPSCQEMLPRTILFSVNGDHGRRKRHTTKGSLLECPKGEHKCNETVMGV